MLIYLHKDIYQTGISIKLDDVINPLWNAREFANI